MFPSRPHRVTALAAALVVAFVSAVVPLGAAPGTHSMPCCKARTHCQTPAFGSACCAPEQAPAAPAPLPNASLKSGPSADASNVVSSVAVAPSPSVAEAASASFLHERLKLPHDPPYLKNVAFRI
jgi:hypothetical protein